TVDELAKTAEQGLERRVDGATLPDQVVQRVGDVPEDVVDAIAERGDGRALQDERAVRDLVVTDRVAVLVESGRRGQRTELEPGRREQLGQTGRVEQRPQVEECALVRVGRRECDRAVGTDRSGGRKGRLARVRSRILRQRTDAHDTVLAEELNSVSEIDVQGVEDVE